MRAIADAVLYEGYLLWPYRRSATKNRQRWTFGGVFPPAHSAAHPDDPAELRAEVLLEGSTGTTVDVTLRFLQVVERLLARGGGSGREYVDELTVGGERYLAWDEAVEREQRTAHVVGGPPTHVAVELPASTEEEPLAEGAAIVRTWKELRGRVEIDSTEVADDRFRVTVHVGNDTSWVGSDRGEALRHAFCSTHVVLHAAAGAFVSATESRGCESVGLWPVLVGGAGERTTMLAAPIILGDYPQIAPESPGDLFDATEIDKLLILNVLSLPPEEQAEMRASDPRAREILNRCAALSPEDLMRLHGALRDIWTLPS